MIIRDQQVARLKVGKQFFGIGNARGAMGLVALKTQKQLRGSSNGIVVLEQNEAGRGGMWRRD